CRCWEFAGLCTLTFRHRKISSHEMRDSPDFQRSITKKLLYSVLICSLTGVAIAVSCVLYLEYKSGVDSQEQDLRYIENALKPSIELALWNFDKEQILSLANGLLTSRNIHSLTIQGQNDRDEIVNLVKPTNSIDNIHCRDTPLRHD